MAAVADCSEQKRWRSSRPLVDDFSGLPDGVRPRPSSANVHIHYVDINGETVRSLGDVATGTVLTAIDMGHRAGRLLMNALGVPADVLGHTTSMLQRQGILPLGDIERF